MKFLFSGKHGSWEEEIDSLEMAKLRACTLNVAVKEVKEWLK